VRQAVAEVDPDMAVVRVLPMSVQVGQNFQVNRLMARLTEAYGLLALAVAALGLYGVTAYGVARRTREIGVRMALGAEAGIVVRLVVRQGMRLALLGVAIGVPAALALAQVISTQLYSVRPVDVPTYFATSAVLGFAALLACWIPARLAARVDPVVALWAE
jgi:macrolide transport system ATP-binding/permease protein